MEVKRQNNIDGILAERNRMYSRFRNEIYRRFVNITQIMAFSNNEEYDDESRHPIQGSFYASSNYGEVSLNHFREERAEELLSQLRDIDPAVEEFIVRDNNLESYFGTPEYLSSIHPNTPANRIITSLSFFLTRYLKDYYQAQNQIARFYFVVDRLDLLVQACDEFESRGVKVQTVQSRKEFVDTLQTGGGGSGTNEITVINIQKFSDDAVAFTPDYNLNIVRIYFMDEAHRSYRPNGSFLANLMSSDPRAIKFALTGTPLISQKLGFNSKERGGALREGIRLPIRRHGAWLPAR